MKKSNLYIIVIIVVVVALFFTFRSFRRGKNNDIEYLTAQVTRGKIVQKVSATGTVNPKAMVIIGSQVSGKVSKIIVDFNSRVKKGQLLAKIDPQIFQARVDQSKYKSEIVA